MSLSNAHHTMNAGYRQMTVWPCRVVTMDGVFDIDESLASRTPRLSPDSRGVTVSGAGHKPRPFFNAIESPHTWRSHHDAQ